VISFVKYLRSFRRYKGGKNELIERLRDRQTLADGTPVLVIRAISCVAATKKNVSYDVTLIAKK